MRRIDLDQNATTPLEPEVRVAIEAALRDLPGNPSTLHTEGRRAREAIEAARASVARLIGAAPEEIVFTSSGTEANNLALCGSVEPAGGHLVVSAIEHPSILQPAAELERRGARVRRVDPAASGGVPTEAILEVLDETVELVSLMLANHETGSIQPVREVAAAARRLGVRVHTDAVQAVGKLPVDAHRLGVDLLTLSAHKIGGPKGVAALWAREGSFPRAILFGGGQELGIRAGTENVAGIVGFGRAAELAASRAAAYAETVAPLRDRLEGALRERVAGGSVVGGGCDRVANTTCIAIEGIEGASLVQLLDLKGVATSTGAACEALSDEVSPVLQALGIPPELARGAVRFSLGIHTTEAEIAEAIERIVEAVGDLQGL